MRRANWLFLGLGAAVAVISGCGDGPAPSSATGSGGATIRIEWPPRSRLIPSACNSIAVTFTERYGSSPKTLAQQVVDRPTDGSSSTVTFNDLPTGSMTVTATAYPQAGAHGTAQASGSQNITITDGEDTPVTVTMASAITSYDLADASVTVGGTVTLSATALNSDGDVVMIPPLTWEITAGSQHVTSVAGATTIDLTTKTIGWVAVRGWFLEQANDSATLRDHTARVDIVPALVAKWGSQGPGDGQFESPRGIAVGPDGSVYVTDAGNSRVEKFTSDGTFVTQWGFQGSANGQFSSPRGLAVDANGDIYVADGGNSRVEVFDSSGSFLRHLGTSGSGDGQFNGPQDVEVGSDGSIWTLGYNGVQHFASDGQFLARWTPKTGSGDDVVPAYQSLMLAVDASGNVYVSSAGDDKVYRYSGDGTWSTEWGGYGNSDGQLRNADGLAVDAAGDVFVADHANHRIQKFSNTGAFLAKWGSQGVGDGQFDEPDDVAIDADGYVYVLELSNHRVQKFRLTAP